MRTALPALVLATALASPGPGALAQDIPPLDVSDVSILFPLASDGQPVPPVPVGSPTPANPEGLLPQGVFDDIIAFARGTGMTFARADGRTANGASARENWRIVGMRFDACAPSVEILQPPERRSAELNALIAAGRLPDACILNFRLIAQPIVGGEPTDYTAHLVYALGVQPKGAPMPEAGVRMLATLGAVKALAASVGGGTDGAPLGVHPGLRRATELDSSRCPSESSLADPRSLLGVPDAQKPCALVRLMGRVVGSVSLQALSSVAFMGLGGHGPEPWIFFPGSVEKDPAKCPTPRVCWKPSVVFNTQRSLVPPGPAGAPPRFVGFSLRQDAPILFEGAAPFSNDAHMGLLFDPGNVGVKVDRIRVLEEGRVVSKSDAGVEARDLVHVINHPVVSNAVNTDCVSCHVVANRIWNLRAMPADPGPLVAKGLLYLPPDGISAFLARDAVPRGFWNVHNFSYFGKQPAVSTRTLHETAAVVAHINGSKPGAGIRCGERYWQAYNCSLTRGADCFAGCTGVAPGYTPARPAPLGLSRSGR